MTSCAMENVGLKLGDKITVKVNDVSKEFTLAGGFKDAVLGSKMSSMTRFIKQPDFCKYFHPMLCGRG